MQWKKHIKDDRRHKRTPVRQVCKTTVNRERIAHKVRLYGIRIKNLKEVTFVDKRIRPFKATLYFVMRSWRTNCCCDVPCFYRTMLHRAPYCYGKLSVCLSVTLRYRDHIGWNSSKIISPFWCLPFADPNIGDVIQGEHPEILAGIGEGYRKRGFQRIKALIYLKHGKRGPRLLLRSNRKSLSYTRFRLVQKWTISDDL